MESKPNKTFGYQTQKTTKFGSSSKRILEKITKQKPESLLWLLEFEKQNIHQEFEYAN